MSWRLLLNLIEAEAGPDLAARIESRARLELGGVRITVASRLMPTAAEVEAAAPGRPRHAARRLGIHPATAYRILRRKAPTIR